jgi:hypothetical protein
MNFFNSLKNINPRYIDFFIIKKFINNINSVEYILINTLPIDQQDCLILKTLTAEKEIIQIQSFQENFILNRNIVIYGKNSIDNTVDIKFQQLVNLGFTNVFIYRGGMFEWCLLQDIYGKDEFQTTINILDPLKWCNNNGNETPNKTNTYNWNNLLTYFP